MSVSNAFMWGYDIVHLQAVALALAAFVTFASYQSIPSDYERIAHRPDGSNTFMAIMRSLTGRMFIRWCGIDHMIMGCIMAGIWLGVIKPTDTMRWVLVGSAAIVALVSVLSAVAIRKATHD